MSTSVMAICPSCIGLGKMIYAGELRICPRCEGEGRVPGIVQYTESGRFKAIVPDPNPEVIRGDP